MRLLILLALAVGLQGPAAGLHIAEDDAGWIPALYGNGQGHVSPFSDPFPSLTIR
jgi:hypothetical protein